MRNAAKDNSQQKVMDSNNLASKNPQIQPRLNDDPQTFVADSSKEEREAQIKATFESLFGKMRDLKAEDPSMFSEIWEKFLKVSFTPFSEIGVGSGCFVVVYYHRSKFLPSWVNTSLTNVDVLGPTTNTF